jgi:hypothetical protein
MLARDAEGQGGAERKQMSEERKKERER